MPGKKNPNGMTNKPANQQRKKKPPQKQTRRGETPRHVSSIQARLGGIGNNHRFALAIALPDEHPYVRLPTSAMERSAILTTRQTQAFRPSVNPPPGFTVPTLLVCLFGQVGRTVGVWTDLPATSGPATHQAAFNTSNMTSLGITNATGWALAPGGTAPSVDQLDASFSMFAPTGHGSTLGWGRESVGKSDYLTCFYLNTGDSVLIANPPGAGVWGSATIVGKVMFEVIRVSGDQEPSSLYYPSNVPVNNGIFTGNASNPTAATLVTCGSGAGQVPYGYYALRYIGAGGAVAGNPLAGTWDANNGGVVSVYLSRAAKYGWRFYSNEDLSGSNGDISIGDSCRVNACSLLMTNTSPLVTRQGSVIAARIQTRPFDLIGAEQLAAMASKYSGDGAKGVYTFKEFSHVNEDFQDFANGNGNTANPQRGIFFPIETSDYYHFIAISATAVLDASTPSVTATNMNTFTTKLTMTIEFKTDSQRYNTGAPRGSFYDLLESRRLINSRPEWFYENFDHMKMIYGLINAAKRGAKFVAPYAAAGLKAMHPQYAPAIDLASRALYGM